MTPITLGVAAAGVLRGFEAAWAARDAATLAGLFTPDADYVDFAGDWLHGRPAIEQAHASVLAGPMSDSTFTFTDLDHTPVENLVLVHTRWRLTGQRTGDGNSVAERRGIITFLLIHHDDAGEDAWSIRAGHNTEARATAFT